MIKDKIGLREILGIYLLILGTKLADMSPALLAHYGKNAFWLIAVVAFLTFFPLYMLMIWMFTRLEDKNLIEASYFLFGKYGGFLLSFSLFGFAMFLTTIDSRAYIDEINNVYFEESPMLAVYFVLIAGCMFGAGRGLPTIGYTAWAIFPYIKFALIFLFILSLNEVVFQRIFPIFGEGPLVILKQGLLKPSLFGGDLILFLVAFTSVKDAETFKKGSIYSLIIAMVEVTVFYSIYCMIFDYKSIDKVAFPFHELTNLVQAGTFFTNVETFFFSFWLVAGFIRLVVYLYLTAWIFSETFKIKDMKPLVPAFGILVITLGFLPEHSIKVVLFYKNYFINSFSMFCYVLPVLFWVGCKRKGVF